VKTRRPPLVLLDAGSLDNSPVFNLGGGKGASKVPFKDDTFDRLFTTADVKKMAAPAACVSNSDRSSDLTSSGHGGGLFQSFHREERVEPAAGRPTKKSYRRTKSRAVEKKAYDPANDISDLYKTLDVQIKCETRVSYNLSDSSF